MGEIEIVPVPAFQDNYIWVMRRGDQAAVVDPGDAQPVLDYLSAEHLRLCAILNTHHHPDHVGGNAELRRQRAVPIYGPHDQRIAELTARLSEGEHFTVDELGIDFSVLEIPGHTRTH